MRNYWKRLREQRDNVDCIITVCNVIILVIAIFLVVIFG